MEDQREVSGGPAAPAPGDPRGESEPAPAPKRVLIVEDEALIALDLERQLLRAGFEVVGVADTQAEAVAQLQAGRPELVLMDINLRGDSDGIETARLLGRLDDVPVIFLTAYADPATLARAAEVSPYGYLLKPFDQRALVATITMALRRHAADTRLRVLEAAVSSAIIGVLLVEAQGERRSISFVNDAFCTISGVPRAMILGQRPCFLAADRASEGVGRLQAAVQERRAASEVVEGRRASGEPFWSSVVISPVADRSGRVSHLLVFHGDITREREAERALVESQRVALMGRLTAGIAHDFGNILGAIAAFADLARGAADEAARADIDEVLLAAERGGRLTRKLLDFARRGAPLSDGHADLSQVLALLRNSLQRLAGPGVALDLRLDPEPMPLGLDATSIEQIVLNLVSNARDALEGEGRVALTASRPTTPSGSLAPGRYVRLEVQDSGPGMDAATAARVFDGFFTTKPTGRGTGLGLYTTRLLVERAGGTVALHTAPGEGSRFTLDLPVVEGLTVEETPSPAVRPLGHAGGAVCLVVDDDRQVRRAAARALAGVGFEVAEAANAATGREAIAALGARLRLLVCDMVLPGGSGTEVLEAARQAAPGAELLVATGYFEESVEQLGPGVSILWKPYTATALVRRALDAIGVDEEPERGAALSQPPLPAPARSPAPVVPVQDARSPQVLVVDGDDPLRRGLRALLEGRGLRVLEASDAAAALALLETEEVHLLVTELGRPEASGPDLLAAARAADSLLPVIVTTAAPSVEVAQRAVRARVKALLVKPVAPDELIAEVERALEEGQVLRLQRKLLASKVEGAGDGRSLAELEQRFEASLAGIEMAWQPIVRTYDRSIYAFEALLRSRGPCAHPGAFLEAGEALGRIDALGRGVRAAVARTLRAHPERYEPVFVNLHPTEFSADLLAREDEPLLPFASRVVLEVTERAQLAAVGDLAETVRILRKIGYRIALDDLGEGYAGLSWLVKLAPDIAKLDMSLVRDIERSRIKRELVASMVNVGRRAGTLIVAEGVETAAEATVLSELGCDLLQGFFFARPGPPFPELS